MAIYQQGSPNDNGLFETDRQKSGRNFVNRALIPACRQRVHPPMYRIAKSEPRNSHNKDLLEILVFVLRSAHQILARSFNRFLMMDL